MAHPRGGGSTHRIAREVLNGRGVRAPLWTQDARRPADISRDRRFADAVQVFCRCARDLENRRRRLDSVELPHGGGVDRKRRFQDLIVPSWIGYLVAGL